mgnify:CR=1 FL=1
MSQDPNITLARGLYNACTLATAQIREAQSLAKEIFPGVEASRAEVLGIAPHELCLVAAHHGDLAAARAHLREGARLHRTIGGSVGEALSLQRLAEVSLHEGRRDEARALIDEALDVARQTDIGFHLMDRIYGTRINLHRDDPDAALYVMEDASESVRGPLETCPGCRITFAVPAAIAAARAGELDLANQHEEQCAYLANVVMRLPAWYAAHEEVRGHIAAARTPGADDVVSQFSAAAARSQPSSCR